MQRHAERESRLATIVIGLLLIFVGVVFLAVQSFGLQLPFDLSQIGWPIYIIAPGVVLLVVGLFLPGAGVGLAIGGGIVTTVGTLLAYQSAYDHYASWAYAWALIPTAFGLSMFLWGILHRRRRLARDGLGTLSVGLIMFLVGFAFFEGVLDVGEGRGFAALGRQALPFALIAAGVLVILTRVWSRPRRAWTGTWPAEWQTWERRRGPGAPPTDAPPAARAEPREPDPTASAPESPRPEDHGR